MKILRPGHRYELESFEPDPDALGQILQFIEKMPTETGEFKTVCNGTTNEEVLRVLIDRLQSLNKKLPSRQTSIAITKCEEALMWLNNRTQERKARGVEGTPQL